MRWLAVSLVLAVIPAARAADDLPPMKFNETREVAPGVFFRYSSISATDPTVPFGGSNHVWVVFADFVVVIDANFPKEAGDAIAAIRKTTDKPIRYVLDTHHHGDHAYGNGVWAKEGATIVGQTNCFRLMTTVGPEQYKLEGKNRKDVAETPYKAPTLVFDEKLVIDDGTQRVEFLHFGHSHTAGDACAYLPKHKILCTGDACVNGAFNYMGHADSASWIVALEKMAHLEVTMICPGHGPVAGKDLFDRQKRYFVEMRRAVQRGIDAKKSLEEITQGLDLPWYKEWTGKEASKIPENVKHVYGELMGTIKPGTLGSLIDLPEGESYSRATPGWTQPRRIVVPNLAPTRIAELRAVAPQVEFVVARTLAEARRLAAVADGVVGYDLDAATLRQVKWAHVDGGMQPSGENGATLTSLPASASHEPAFQWAVWRENVRRFAAGERLLGVVAR